MEAILFVFVGLGLAWVVNGYANGWPQFRRPDRLQSCAYCEKELPAGPSALWTYLRLAGRCPHCAAPLPLRPPLVELVLVAGVPLLWIADAGDWPRFLLHVLYLAVGTLIVAIDAERLRIPNLIVYPMLGVALVAALVGLGPLQAGGQVATPAAVAVGGIVGFGSFFMFFLAGALFVRLLKGSSGPALGFGDVKLAGLVGLVTGFPGINTALVVTVIAGAVFAVAMIVLQLVQRRYKPGKALPYGPFLVLGALWALVMH